VKLIFDKSVPGRCGLLPPEDDTGAEPRIDESLLRDSPAALPELSELDVVRHFTKLSTLNFGVDSGFYPLGSCTMKYNPKMAERSARHEGFTALHPELARIPGGERLAQGALAILYHTDLMLREICGMSAFTTQPMAGANGELTGVLLIAAYHRSKGNADKRVILIPDSAHGTNPASAALAGYDVKTIGSDENGLMDLDALQAACTDEVAGIMLTCPNTLGLFNPHVREICEAVHAVDGLAYYDGANLNALLGRAKPGDLGFDIVHVNLHKTFATPHGGGGPGAGPVGVCEKLADFLPAPRIVRRDDGYALDEQVPHSIGKIAGWYGSFGIIARAYAYMLRLGRQGMLDVSEHAVLNANYLRVLLREHFDLPFDRVCMHECVFSASRQAAKGVHAMDVAKALIDRGFHPPTVYFPLIVEEAMMVEPTETEAPETLDTFVEAMIEIARLAQDDPESLAHCPRTTCVGRLDETLAARKPDLASLPPGDRAQDG
jgi:glycine dehydrogenase subunit 2